MERAIEILHISMEVKADFKGFTQAFEQSLGRFDDSLVYGLETDPKGAEERLSKAAGEEGMMLFNIREHGTLQNIYGKSKNAKQYVVGNPLIATTMTRHDIRAGLYAPLRLLVYEADDHSTYIEFDKPSSLFGQFDNPEVTAVARSLDEKLLNLIKKAEERASDSNSLKK